MNRCKLVLSRQARGQEILLVLLMDVALNPAAAQPFLEKSCNTS